MEYRKFEKLNIAPSVLGWGCMRMPKKEDGTIDEAEAERMIDYAISQGVTYIDTAYPYHNGESEPFVGKVLKKYPRDAFYLATKLPIWELKTKEDVARIFNAQLERLGVDYVDFYLLHALDAKKWQTVLDLDILPFVDEMKKAGKIKNIGFSFHDEYATFEKIITYRPWDFCQIQYNYMDIDIQAGDKGYALAEKLGVPLVIMEPIKGGSLATLPKDIDAIFKSQDENASTASWALRWVASHSNCKVILSGMSTFEQLEDNLKTFNREDVNLNEQEMATVAKVREAINARMKNGCTGCAYCMPCPFGINIPQNFAIWNREAMYGDTVKAKNDYATLSEAQAALCKKCGKCEKVCPQALPIREDLARVAKDLGE